MEKPPKNKRKIIVLVVCVLLVVGAVLVGIFWLDNSSSVQVWIQNWLENPLGLTAIATVGAAIGTVGAVIVALFGIRNEQKKAREDRVEVRRQLEDALHASNRPLLVPVAYKQELEVSEINILKGTFRIHNQGTGIATNVVGGCFNHVDIFTVRRIASSIFQQEYKELKLEEPTKLVCKEDKITDKITEYTLCSDKENTHRLVITYHDMFRIKHGSIFDGYFNPELEPPVAEWTCIAFLDHVYKDLAEMIEMSKSSDETKS